jgi:serine/threonine protein kinase
LSLAAPSERPPFSPGEILDGKYRIGELLGEGAMGLVFEAQHLLLDKKVAVKVLRPELTGNEELRRRFEIEARAAAAVAHPNVVTVSDMGRTAHGAVYFVMDRLVGETLAHRLERVGYLPFPTTVAIALEILEALEAAHAVGLVHRDLKPENVFIAAGPGGRERVKVLDFGVAKVNALGGSSSATRTGVLIGTPQFMAPEQARGDRQLDARADLYALGVMFYLMVSGRAPFRGDSAVAMIAALLTETPTDLALLCPDLPPAVVSLVTSAMSRDREQRPGTAAEFRARLQAACAEAPRPAAAMTAKKATTSDLVPLDHQAGSVHQPPLALVEAPPPRLLPRTSAPPPSASLAAHGDGDRPLELDTPSPVVSTARHRPRGQMAPPPDERSSIAAGAFLRRLAGPAMLAAAALVGWHLLRPTLQSMDLHLLPATRLAAPAAPAAQPLPLIADSDKVTVEVDLSPATAVVALDGKRLSSLSFELARSHDRHTLRATREGYASATVQFVADETKTVQLRLNRLRRAR